MSSLQASRLRLIMAAALFSTGGAAIKSIDLSMWQVACFRSGVAALTLLLLIPSARRLNHLAPWLVGFSFSATMILFATSNKLTTAANTIFLQATAPAYLILLAPWLLKERIRLREILFLIPLLCGMSLFFLGSEPARVSAPDPALGNLLAAISGFFWAGTIFGLRLLGRAGGSGQTAAAASAGSLISFGVTLPLALPVAQIGVMDVSLLLFLGIFQIGLAYALMGRGMVDVPAIEASLILMLEPVLNPVWAFIFQGELPRLMSAAGCGIIFTAIVLKTAIDARLSARPADSEPGKTVSCNTDDPPTFKGQPP